VTREYTNEGLGAHRNAIATGEAGEAGGEGERVRVEQCSAWPEKRQLSRKGGGRRSRDRRVFGAAADPRHRCGRPPSVAGDRDGEKEERMQGAGVSGKRIDRRG